MIKFTRRAYLLALVSALLNTAATTAYAQSVIATGMGINRSAALENAKRNAIEQVVGAVISAKTVMENYQIVQDKIYSRSSGYLTGYTVLSEGKSEEDGTWRVTIQTSVKTRAVKNDLQAIGILLARVGNPRFMAIHLPATKTSLPPDSPLTLAARQAICGVFARKGFIVLDRAMHDKVYASISRAGQRTAGIDHLATQAQKGSAELLLLYDARAIEKTEADDANRVTVEISLCAVAAATAELIDEKKSVLNSASAGYDETQAGAMLGERTAEELLDGTLAYFQRAVDAGIRLCLRFQNFSEEETYTITAVIEAMPGVKDKNVRNESPDNFQLDVNFQGDKFDFKRRLYQGLKKEAIFFKTKQSEGNRLLLVKKTNR
jgi:hypothetical protein